MRLYTEPVSRTERAASVAVATAVTMATSLLILVSVQPREAAVSAPIRTRNADSAFEHLAYVLTHPHPAVAPTTPIARPSPRSEPQHAATRPARGSASSSYLDDADSSANASVAPPVDPAQTPPTGIGGRWISPGISPRLRPDSAATGPRTSAPSAIVNGPWQLPHLPLSQSDRDAQARADALAGIAARAAGLPVARGMSGGGHIDAPLPFGGPSRKQRDRDSTINAQTKESLARVFRRLDSVTAARRRRNAQSLAGAEDSSRRDTQP